MFGSVGEGDQRFAAEVLGNPTLRWLRADAAIEVDRRRVPVEHVPCHVTALARGCDARHVAEQGVTDAVAAVGGFDVDVFDEQAVLAGEGAEQEIPESETDGGAVYFGEDRV